MLWLATECWFPLSLLSPLVAGNVQWKLIIFTKNKSRIQFYLSVLIFQWGLLVILWHHSLFFTQWWWLQCILIQLVIVYCNESSAIVSLQLSFCTFLFLFNLLASLWCHFNFSTSTQSSMTNFPFSFIEQCNSDQWVDSCHHCIHLKFTFFINKFFISVSTTSTVITSRSLLLSYLYSLQKPVY